MVALVIVRRWQMECMIEFGNHSRTLIRKLTKTISKNIYCQTNVVVVKLRTLLQESQSFLLILGTTICGATTLFIKEEPHILLPIFPMIFK